MAKVVGDRNQREIKRLTSLVDEVNALEATMRQKSNDELRDMIAGFRADVGARTTELRQQLSDTRVERDAASGDTRRHLEIEADRLHKELLRLEADLMQETMPQVFAAVREASRRTTGLRHYDVQVVGLGQHGRRVQGGPLRRLHRGHRS